ncbi:conserved hypothetical protein [Trichormus variabilis ATCC 29413]|uniref:Uncharacterized protein n=2 Tax=Anabaena variabilis TaxID=264691 RepID=Q3MB04_TRIV2|nr:MULTISPECIES: hypothetical protein [Nostocaceae]ABA21832.1 conserved hypothetical protein [Trichormus variabilis ATCC 29413]MBC1214818.1 hypothetical protein [Trichormus variabilis ARAD]MBC1257811.1 hypothetical protein [Trichormus variabilis V5]MBC1266904.1 hypothetical protein [Trichormus variabilis FSR]MBC1303661.1 hypothetical protein [Trichormus variabilis N2B]
MVQQMLRRLVQWLKSFFQGLFGGGRKQTAVKTSPNVTKQPAPPLGDTDLEFLFTELLEGVHQARGQAWAVKWLQKIEHRVTTAQWVEWLRRFGEKLLASSSPNNELAARLVQLGELGVGELGDVAYDIGMQVLSRNQGEPIWEYDGPDLDSTDVLYPEESVSATEENPEGEYQTVTLEQLFEMLQEDENLRQQIAEQLAIETDDPQVIVEALMNQYYAASQQATE